MKLFNRRREWCERHAMTDQGLSRAMNEDRVAVLELGHEPVWGYGVVVADGMGGAAGGERASRLAVEGLRTRLSDWQVELSRLGSRWQDVMEGHLREIIDGIHVRLHRETSSDPSLEGMGTTLAMVLVFGDRFLTVHVGDSRAYRLRGDAITQLTRDHTFGEYQRAAGLEAARADDGKLMQFLGGNEPPEPEFNTGAIQPGDLFLVASDGLTRYADGAELGSELAGRQPLDRIGHGLVARANRSGGRDNISVGLLRINSVPGPKLGPVGAGAPVQARAVTTWPVAAGGSGSPASAGRGWRTRLTGMQVIRVALLSMLTVMFCGVSVGSWIWMQKATATPVADATLADSASTVKGPEGEPPSPSGEASARPTGPVRSGATNRERGLDSPSQGPATVNPHIRSAPKSTVALTTTLIPLDPTPEEICRKLQERHRELHNSEQYSDHMRRERESIEKAMDVLEPRCVPRTRGGSPR